MDAELWQKIKFYLCMNQSANTFLPFKLERRVELQREHTLNRASQLLSNVIDYITITLQFS
jgi:hypothetical protein